MSQTEILTPPAVTAADLSPFDDSTPLLGIATRCDPASSATATSSSSGSSILSWSSTCAARHLRYSTASGCAPRRRTRCQACWTSRLSAWFQPTGHSAPPAPPSGADRPHRDTARWGGLRSPAPHHAGDDAAPGQQSDAAAPGLRLHPGQHANLDGLVPGRRQRSDRAPGSRSSSDPCNGHEGTTLAYVNTPGAGLGTWLNRGYGPSLRDGV